LLEATSFRGQGEIRVSVVRFASGLGAGLPTAKSEARQALCGSTSAILYCN
jgi:hypothetical protein